MPVFFMDTIRGFPFFLFQLIEKNFVHQSIVFYVYCVEEGRLGRTADFSERRAVGSLQKASFCNQLEAAL